MIALCGYDNITRHYGTAGHDYTMGYVSTKQDMTTLQRMKQ